MSLCEPALTVRRPGGCGSSQAEKQSKAEAGRKSGGAKAKKNADRRIARSCVSFEQPKKCPPVPVFTFAHKAITNSSARTRCFSVLTTETVGNSSCARAKDRKMRKDCVRLMPRPEYSFPIDVLREKHHVFDGRPMEDQTTPLPGAPSHVKVVPVQTLHIHDSSDPKKGTRCFVKNHELGSIFTLLPRQKSLSRFGKLPALHHAFERIETCSKQTDRGKGKTVCLPTPGSRCTCAGSFPMRNAEGLGMRWEATVSDRHLLESFIEASRKTMEEHMPSRFLKGICRAKGVVDCNAFVESGLDEVFGGVACGKNVFLSSHKDDDAFYSISSVVAAPGVPENKVLCCFTFPACGVAVALRSGDILVFNPQVHHSVSSATDLAVDYHCLSLHLKTSLVGLNHNDLPLTTTQFDILAEQNDRITAKHLPKKRKNI